MPHASTTPDSRTTPLSPAQSAENAAFLDELRRTGNAREAARRLGAHRAKFTRRRAKHPAFAAQWEIALACAQAKLAAAPGDAGLIRRADGRLQLRRPRPKGLDHRARTRFLAALSACANVRLAAKAAGFSHAAFYHHKRRDPTFAREWRLALDIACERLEIALLQGWGAADADDWSRNALPPIAPMSPAQALQLLYLHQKEARLLETPEPLRRRRGESAEARNVRLSLIYEAGLQRERDAFDLAEAERRKGKLARPQPPPPLLPDLAQVTGWSKASGKPAHDASVALFGGWRIGG